MRYFDSWMFLELFFEDEKYLSVADLFKQSQKEGILLSAIGLFEIKYRLVQKIGQFKAGEALVLIENIPFLHIVPVVSSVSLLAADLRLKYYEKYCQMSFADALHLATAIQTHCSALYTGDPDFEKVEEIKVFIIR